MLLKLLVSTLISIAQANPITTGKTQLVLLNQPSQLTISANPANPCLDPPLIGGRIYLEVWVQTNWMPGLFSAVVDITYDTTVFDTTIQQVMLDQASWGGLFVPTTVDDTIGHINNLGGTRPFCPKRPCNRPPLGAEPEWERLGIITFDVIQTPTNPVIFKSEFAGLSPGSGFPLLWVSNGGTGNMPQENVDFGQICIGCSPSDMNQDGDVDLKDYAKLMQTFEGPK